MREIKFRGKRLDTGKLVEGCLVASTGQINNGKRYILPGIADFSYGDNGNRCRIGCFVEVDPSTVGQYTGLKDKNGVEIYEGDIVRHGYSNNNGDFYDNDPVVFSVSEGSYKIQRKDIYSKRLTKTTIEKQFIEVIGNIHE